MQDTKHTHTNHESDLLLLILLLRSKVKFWVNELLANEKDCAL